jgi:hypothetical protein
MSITNTSDISDEYIAAEIDFINVLYKTDIDINFRHSTPDSQRRVHGLVSPCCDNEQKTLLIRLVRILMENFPAPSGRHIHTRYAVAAILYYYYQLHLIETHATGFLDLSVLPMLYPQIKKSEVNNILRLSNFLIISDEPYVVEIRRAIMPLNPEPFVGGRKHKRTKNGNARKNGNRIKIGTRHNRRK